MIEAVRWVLLEAPITSKADLLVLIVLAEEDRGKGAGVWLSVRTIAERARAAERSVQESLRRLVADGLLTAEPRPGQTTVYRLTGGATTRTPATARTPASRRADPRDHSHPTPATTRTQAVKEPLLSRPPIPPKGGQRRGDRERAGDAAPVPETPSRQARRMRAEQQIARDERRRRRSEALAELTDAANGSDDADARDAA